ncbi:MAG: PEP-CTERM sorting domain-containing protein [Verrucomicrobia bacterium]|nr:PEP-CTERM sorting domain-containing protein [Verrucomicrobiota bacterium]
MPRTTTIVTEFAGDTLRRLASALSLALVPSLRVSRPSGTTPRGIDFVMRAARLLVALMAVAGTPLSGHAANVPWKTDEYILSDYSNFGQILGQWSQNDQRWGRNTLYGYVTFQGGADVTDGDLVFWSQYDRQVLGRYSIVALGEYDLSSGGYGIVFEDLDIPGDQGGLDGESLGISWMAENGSIYGASWDGTAPVIDSGVGSLGIRNVTVNTGELLWVPEPSTWALIALGTACLAVARRRNHCSSDNLRDR